MAFAKDASRVRLNGRSIVYVKPTGGAYTDIGFVSDVMAKAEAMNEETTLGDLPVGYNLSIEGNLKQVTVDDFSSMLDNAFPDGVKVTGTNDTAEITNPTMTASLEKKFDGKTGSVVKFSAQYKGASKATAQSFIRSGS